MDARIADEPMLNNQKILSFGGPELRKNAAYDLLRFLGCAQEATRLPH
jgi:hypothetical protein